GEGDAEVHRLYDGTAVQAIEAAFPSAVRGGKVNRAALAKEVAGSPQKLKQLEAIVHPMVVKAEIDFLRDQEKRGAALAVLEIPLLFETDAHLRIDVTVVVSAPEAVQRARVLERPARSPSKLQPLLNPHLPDAHTLAHP